MEQEKDRAENALKKHEDPTFTEKVKEGFENFAEGVKSTAHKTVDYFKGTGPKEVPRDETRDM